MSTLPTAKDLKVKMALAEGEKASAAAKAQSAADAERQAFLDRISKPSELNDDQLLEKASHIVSRAAGNGLTSVEVFRFPNQLCTDNGRAIDQAEDRWEETLTGIPRDLYDFWARQLKPRGYHIKYEVADRPKGVRGDIVVILSWD